MRAGHQERGVQQHPAWTMSFGWAKMHPLRQAVSRGNVSSLNIALMTFVLTLGSAVLCARLRDRLPPQHLTKESQDVVRLGMGLVATMTALLLGLVTAAARGTFDSQDDAIKNSAANILTLDRHLARYGPETRTTREFLKQAVAFRLAATWPEYGPAAGVEVNLSTPPVEELQNQLLALTPQNDTQRWLKSEALKLSEELLKMRWRVLGSSRAIPNAFLAIVIFWLTVTFASFGLYAPRNATVLSVFVLAAISVAAAIFLVMELDGPLDGVIKVSGAPIRYALDNLGQ